MQTFGSDTLKPCTGSLPGKTGLARSFNHRWPVGRDPVVSWPVSGPPSRAISVGTAPMIAIARAGFMRPVAMSVGLVPQTCCNDLGHDPRMIAIPPADVCGSLQLLSVSRAGGPERLSDRACGGCRLETAVDRQHDDARPSARGRCASAKGGLMPRGLATHATA